MFMNFLRPMKLRTSQKKRSRRKFSRLLRTESLEGRRLLAADVWINELHYDNSGNDANEFVEVAGPAGTDLTGWSVVFYNGNGGVTYATVNLTGTIDDEAGTGFGALSFLQSGIQNGAPDGLALVDDQGAVIQFLSYEGSFAATNGPASGLTSVDIGVSQSGNDAAGLTLQLKGVGTTYADFTWNAPTAESPGSLNDGQSIAGANPGILVTVTGAGNEVSEQGPTSDSFSLVLTQQPTADVTVTVASTLNQVTLDAPTTLVFTPADWDVPQNVNFTAVDDTAIEGDHVDTLTFTVSSGDTAYDGFAIPAQTVDIIDNDFGDLVPALINEFVGDHVGSDTLTFAEMLAAPNADLGVLTLVELEGDSINGNSRGVIDRVFQLGVADANGYYVVPNSAGFDPENGAVTLLLVYGFTGSVTQDLDTNEDGILDVTPWISIVDSVGYRSAESEFVYSPAVLEKRSDTGLTVFGGASRIPNGTDTDSPSDWVSNDFTGEGLGLGGIAPPGQAINTPGQPNIVKPGVNVVQSDGTTAVVEGGATDTLSIVLFSQPTSDVTITITVDSQVAVSLSSLVFTSANWNVPQEIVVTAIDDSASEGPHTGLITFAVGSADPEYDAFSIAPITVDVTDNDVAGVVIEPTSGLVTTEAGGSASFMVRLSSPPAADVEISLTSSDTTEGTVSPASLVFNSSNWNVSQTVTVTGVDDEIDDGNIVYSIITGNTVSADFNYDFLDVEDVTLTNIDDDFNQSALINEVLVNPPGNDGPFEYVELTGIPGSSLSGFYFVQLEGDGAAAGIADFVVDLSSFSFGSNGLLIIKAAAGGHTPALGTTIVTDSRLDATGGAFENGTLTNALIFSPLEPIVGGQDYDTANGGSLSDLPTDAVIVDTVGWSDGGQTDIVYGSAVLEQSDGTPDAATRFPSVLTSTAAAWYAGDIVDTTGSSSLTYDVSRATTPIPQGATLTPGDVNFAATPAQQFALEASLSASEGNTGVTSFVFNVLRLGDSVGAAVVDYAFVAGDTDAADFGGVLPVGGQVAFADGQEVATITIDVSGDTIFESDEVFGVALVATTVGVVLQGANSASATIVNDDSADAVPPTVSSVFATSSVWTPGFIDSIDGGGAGAGNGLGLELTPGLPSLPWSNVNRLVIQFSEDVVGVDSSSLQLLDSSGPLPITVNYDASTQRAVIVLTAPVTYAKLRVAVSDAVTDAAGNMLDGDGSGAAGGVFDRRFDILAGDTDANGRVNTSDLVGFSAAFNSQPGDANYATRLNWDGAGRINTSDLSVLANNFTNNLVDLAEPPPPFSGGRGTAFYGVPHDEFFKKFGFDDEESGSTDNLTQLR